MNLKLIGVALAASIGLAQSQTHNTSIPKFEVTSVKPNKSPDLGKGGVQLLPGGRFVATNIPLIRVIAVAWNLPLQSQRLTLAPGVKMPDDIYDIEATVEKGTFPPGITTEARLLKMRLMVQALLEDRFKLRVRPEPKEEPVYALVVGKGGPKFEKSKFQEQDCGDTSSKWIGNPACHWLDGGHSDRATLFDVFEELGLRMESQRAVIDMFVIDHVERPNEN